VVCTTNDAGAYRELVTRKFAALLVDINLGRGTTGFDVARHARRSIPTWRWSTSPADRPTPCSARRSRRALVLKPFDRDDLLGALEEVGIGLSRRRDGDESTGAPVL
jgi:hypothetical protein